MAGWPAKCATFSLLFGIALFLSLHHSVSEVLSRGLPTYYKAYHDQINEHES
jgi:hypothetical protein